MSRVIDGCAERLPFTLPTEQGSYRATVWMRHGGIAASVVLRYVDGLGLDGLAVQMSPTGRATRRARAMQFIGFVCVRSGERDRAWSAYPLTVAKLVPCVVEASHEELCRTGPDGVIVPS